VEHPPAQPDRRAALHEHRERELVVAAGAAHVYTECAHIWNPIHTDRAVAIAAGLPDIILHGTATLALAVSAIVREELGDAPARVSRIAARFGAMVMMPSVLTLRIEASSEAALWFSVRNDTDEAAIRDGMIGLR
jgi:acyl dehydratase